MYFPFFLIFFALAIIAFYQMETNKKPAWVFLSLALCAYIWLMLISEGVQFAIGINPSTGTIIYETLTTESDLTIRILSLAGLAGFFISIGETLLAVIRTMRK